MGIPVRHPPNINPAIHQGPLKHKWKRKPTGIAPIQNAGSCLKSEKAVT
jgi:hypothetical protein